MRKGFIITLSILIGILLIGGIIYLVLFSKQQSVLSVSSVNVGQDGKVYWVFYASANKPNEQYLFTSNPSTYTKSDGTQVTPKSPLTLVISPSQPNCVYQSTQREQKYNLGLSKFTYYVLNNPTKNIDVEITDRNGVIKTLDGTSVNSITISDTDGKGSVTVESQGLLSGKYNCPNYDNVVVYTAKDGQTGYFYLSEWNSYFGTGAGSKLGTIPSTLSSFQSNTKLNYNTGFTNSFISLPNYDDTKVTGGINFGYPTFTITTDQDYFNSVVYIPPKNADPRIDDINAPSKIEQDSSSSGTVDISNRGNSGTVYLSINSDVFSISGFQSNFKLDTSKTISFTIKAPNTIKCGDINVQVCSTSQFSSNTCDTDKINICTVEKQKQEDITCGDDICSSSETQATCPTDCGTGSVPDNTLECKWFETQKSKTRTGIFGKTTQINKCVLSSWVYLVSLAILLGLVIVVLSLRNKYGKK